MPQYMYAARTNLTSANVNIHENHVIGVGTFRTCFAGTYVGGTRNGQDAACKRFKPEFWNMEDEYFAQDVKIGQNVIMMATKWNEFCEKGKEIVVNSGTIHTSRSGIKYLVEPFIPKYEKFTSNNGYIADTKTVRVRCMEAFTHYSYHHTGGEMIVCDLQGRYKKKKNRRFELSDPAICSRRRQYGPTDLGEKGIDSFFANHRCNEFCQSHWIKPLGQPRCWFPQSSGSTMLPSDCTDRLSLKNPTTDFFRSTSTKSRDHNQWGPWNDDGLDMIAEDLDDDVASYDEDDW